MIHRPPENTVNTKKQAFSHDRILDTPQSRIMSCLIWCFDTFYLFLSNMTILESWFSDLEGILVDTNSLLNLFEINTKILRSWIPDY